MINNNDILNMMDHKYALFGLFFSFHNRLQATGDSFYEETVPGFLYAAKALVTTDSQPITTQFHKFVITSHMLGHAHNCQMN